jgi:hypothetical protein
MYFWDNIVTFYKNNQLASHVTIYIAPKTTLTHRDHSKLFIKISMLRPLQTGQNGICDLTSYRQF